MREMERIGNEIEQLQNTMAGLIERLVKLEGTLLTQQQSKKPLVYIDKETALLSAEDTDIEWVRNKLKIQ